MIYVQDNLFSEAQIADIRQSAMNSGFGTWTPPSHTFGSGVYQGMTWNGKHAPIHRAISKIMGTPIFANASFFRILTKDGDTRLIHSDRNEGDYTAILYLSSHKEESGTAFYAHKGTGCDSMPAIQEMGDTEMWNAQMQNDLLWTETAYIKGLLGRLLIFSAPLFHGRVPKVGIGDTAENARMIHVTHFEI